MRLCSLAGVVCLVSMLAVGCGSPPQREMDQAQGAIDAARAAGAERYAPDEIKAATAALKQANQAVSDRDYRLALNHALVSREQAQNAVRVAADTRVKLRGDVERSMAEVTALITQERAWIASPAAARTPRTRRTAQQVVAQATGELQKAGSAMQAEDYTGALEILSTTKQRLEKVLPKEPAAPAAQSSKRRK